jgi:Domain of unknown function (DUF4375)
MVTDLLWLKNYSGQNTEDLLDLVGEYRSDSIVYWFEQILHQKVDREGEESLSTAEKVVVAIEALEREVNNGGYDQFFANSSSEYAPFIVEALDLANCPKTAALTQRAIDALRVSELSAQSVWHAVRREDAQRDQTLNAYDQTYYLAEEDLTGNLLTFIRANRASIRIP